MLVEILTTDKMSVVIGSRTWVLIFSVWVLYPTLPPLHHLDHACNNFNKVFANKSYISLVKRRHKFEKGRNSVKKSSLIEKKCSRFQEKLLMTFFSYPSFPFFFPSKAGNLWCSNQLKMRLFFLGFYSLLKFFFLAA